MANRAAAITTRISATGNEPCSCAGFTLIELMIVIVIMGVMMAVTLSVVGDNRPAYLLRHEVRRLQNVLRVAADDAVLHGQDWGMFVTLNGYRFARFDGAKKQWLLADDPLLAPYTVSDALSLTLESVLPLALAADTATPSGQRPTLLLLSSGQTSAFSLKLQVAGDERDSALLSTDGRSGILLSDGGHAKKP